MGEITSAEEELKRDMIAEANNLLRQEWSILKGRAITPILAPGKLVTVIIQPLEETAKDAEISIAVIPRRPHESILVGSQLTILNTVPPVVLTLGKFSNARVRLPLGKYRARIDSCDA